MPSRSACCEYGSAAWHWPFRASAQASTSSPSIDGRSRVRDPRELERVRQADAVVDVEERDLEVGAHAVRAQQLLDRADQRVLAPRASAGRPVTA